MKKRIRWLPEDTKELKHFLPNYLPPQRRYDFPFTSGEIHFAWSSKLLLLTIPSRIVFVICRPGRKPLAALSVETATAPLPPSERSHLGAGLKFAIETRGCQMNVADSEVVRALLVESGFTVADGMEDADIVLVNTCAIRERAEDKVWQFLHERRAGDRKLGLPRRTYALLGCMAERLKDSILEHPARLVDVVVGPDAYRDLPFLLSAVANGDPGAVGYNVQLSVEETYSDIAPLREDRSKLSAFVSIARSCSMSCSFCIVPHVRGPERSRDMKSILTEVKALIDEGVKEVVLVGQNVNNYHRGPADSEPGEELMPIPVAPGFGLPGVRVPTYVFVCCFCQFSALL